MGIFFEVIGVAAGLLVTGASFPQLLHTYKSKNVAGLSFGTFCVWALGALCWAVYGAYLGSYQMVIFNFISLICSCVIMYMIKRYKK